jgi:hypothetical protein
MTSSPRRALALFLITPALFLAACGGSSDSSKITDLVKKIDKDGAALCDNATDKLLQQVGGTVDSCKTAARGYPNDDHIKGDIAVKVDGSNATADFTTEKGKKTHVTLVKSGDSWKVDSST